MKKQQEKERMLTRAENAVKDFIAYLDQMFFEGYAEQLAANYPQEWTAQYTEFLDNYYSR